MISKFFKWLSDFLGIRKGIRIGDVVDGITIRTQSQIDKRTDFKIGESYRLGEMIVTLRSSKEEVQAIIAKYDKIRQEKEARLRERGIDLMMMSPEQLQEFKLNEWLTRRNERQSFLQKLMGKVYSGSFKDKLPKWAQNRYISPEDPPPSNLLKPEAYKPKERIIKSNKEDIKEEVKV